MIYAQPGQTGSKMTFKKRYDNFINGEWVAPFKGKYTKNIAPATGKPFCEVPCSSIADLDLALDAAHAAREGWGKTPVKERAAIMNRIADRIEENTELLALAEAWDKGKVIKDVLSGDIPGTVDTYRYFAACIRAQTGEVAELDHETVCCHFREPLGVVGAIIPWNYSLLMAGWKLGPALAAGNCVILKPASLTPASVLVFAELIGDLLPPGVLNIVNGPGPEIGKALASSPRIAKVALTGETTTGRLIMQYAAQNITSVTLELGGKSPNIFFEDIAVEDDPLIDKALEGMLVFCNNSGEFCTCPSRAIIQESIFDKFMEKAIARLAGVKQGNPLDTETQVGSMVSAKQLDRTANYVKIGLEEGAECLIGGEKNRLSGDLSEGYYYKPTILKGHNRMRVFQEEIFGPVLCVTTFRDEKEALEIANDTVYGLGAGVWSRDINVAYRMARGIQAGHVWINNYLDSPMHAAFGGYKMSGLGRENFKTTLDHYQQIKCVHISSGTKTMGLF